MTKRKRKGIERREVYMYPPILILDVLILPNITKTGPKTVRLILSYIWTSADSVVSAHLLATLILFNVFRKDKLPVFTKYTPY